MVTYAASWLIQETTVYCYSIQLQIHADQKQTKFTQKNTEFQTIEAVVPL